MSCLAEQAKILFAEAEENNLDWGAKNPRFRRWDTCSLCEQKYHGVVACALSWACWKTYLGRPETDQLRGMAMDLLGGGLFHADRHEDALAVREANLAMLLRTGAPEEQVLAVQGNLGNSYHTHGQSEKGLRMLREVYLRYLKLDGEIPRTLMAASNYASTLNELERFEEAKPVMRKTIPVAQCDVGESNELTLKMRSIYAQALYMDDGATLDDFREAVETLEDATRIARRVLGATNPITDGIERQLRASRVALSDASTITDAFAAMAPPGKS